MTTIKKPSPSLEQQVAALVAQAEQDREKMAEMAGKLDAMERISLRNTELEAENAALQRTVGRVGPQRLTADEVYAKADAIIEASRAPAPEGKYEWRFAIIVEGQYHEDGTPVTMSKVIRWRCDHKDKAHAVADYNVATGSNFKAEQILAYPVGFEPSNAPRVVKAEPQPVAENWGTPV